MWHSLDKEGNIKLYDVYWPSTKMIESNIPAGKLIGEGEMHEHEKVDENTPIDERKRKKKKRMPSGLGFAMDYGVSGGDVGIGIGTEE